MASKGFIHSFLSSLIVALLAFSIIYFFVPGMSEQFFGISFSSRGVNGTTQIDKMVDGAVATVTSSPEFTQQSIDKLQELLKSDEVQAKLKAAALQGEQALKDAVNSVSDAVK